MLVDPKIGYRPMYFKDPKDALAFIELLGKGLLINESYEEKANGKNAYNYTVEVDSLKVTVEFKPDNFLELIEEAKVLGSHYEDLIEGLNGK